MQESTGEPPSVIEEMAKWLARLTSSDDAWDTWFSEEDRISYRQKAQELFNMATKGMVRLSDNQSLPERHDAGVRVRAYITQLYEYYRMSPNVMQKEFDRMFESSRILQIDIEKHMYLAAQQDMLRAGFRRMMLDD